MVSTSGKLSLHGSKEDGAFKYDHSKTISSGESETSATELIEIKISIREYRNICTVYPIGDIKTICNFDGRLVGETCLLPLTDSDIQESGDSFKLKMNKCPENIDKLLSLPAILTVNQYTGTFDYNLYEQLMCTPVQAPPVKSIESKYSIYEAIDEDNESMAFIEGMASKQKKPVRRVSKKKSTTNEELKTQSGTSRTDTLQPKLKPIKPMSMVYGMCVVDFLPLFRGKCAFSETLPIKKLGRFDDRMTTHKRVPTIVIDVSIDVPLGYEHNTIAYFTLESIYNLPGFISDEMNCFAAAHFPSFENSVCGPILFKNAVLMPWKEETTQFKCWPNMPAEEDNPNTTKYWVNPDKQDALCTLDMSIDECLPPIIPRLTFNMVKRVVMDERALDKLSSQAEEYKHILVEFYFTAKGVERKSPRSHTTKSRNIPDIHGMALVRISTLILPGETKIRIAVPIIPFNSNNVKSLVGPVESIFAPLIRKKTVTKSTRSNSPKGWRNKEKDTKTTRASQTTKSDVAMEGTDLLPDPNTDFYSGTALPVFAIIEIELTNPIAPKLNSEELNSRLEMFLRPPQSNGKDGEDGSTTHLRKESFEIINGQEGVKICEHCHLDTCYSLNQFDEVIFNIVLDLLSRFSRYIDTIPHLRDQPTSAISSRFPEFLDKIGAYTRYNATISEALAAMASTRNAPVEPCVCVGCNMPLPAQKDSTDLDSLFRDATKAINRVVNQMRPTDVESSKVERDTFFYAKEALEMGMVVNAERILLEIICTDGQNADYWFKYALFLIESGQLKKATKCLHEGVMVNDSHKYCLLVYGMLLEHHHQRMDAETMLLNVVAKEPRWFEGWGVLYLFHSRHNNDAGMEWASEKMRKLLTVTVSSTDDFSRFEDLTYGSIGTQPSIPSRLVRFLIKIRMFGWAETYMAGITDDTYELDMRYLYAVISYYKRDYENCINELEELKLMVEEKYEKNIIALHGHCLANLGREDEALNSYRTIFEILDVNPSWNLLHLVSLKYAKLLTKHPSKQNLFQAKDALLRFCQCKQTPLTWMLLGHTCYIENDFLQSELCLERGNELDNCNGDIWALLAMVNIKLGNYDNVDICFNQAIKNNFDTVEYGTEIEMKLKDRASKLQDVKQLPE